ncbi:MAG: hypothetical protein ACOYVK_09185 [Bacillota bacterium]
MNIHWSEWLGYLASLIVLMSLLMSSIIKLRWLNLLGSGIFSLYGFLIGALPVGYMNLCISIINVYYLVKIYRSKEYFKILPIEGNSPYFNYFLDFYSSGIEEYAHTSQFNINDFDVSFYILRNLVPAGVFIASKYDENTLKVELDFAIPEYRDFKIGNYIYENRKDYFLDKGYSRFISFSSNNDHIKYLKKMGFKEAIENDSTYFVKSII